MFEDKFDAGNLDKWTVISLNSNKDWIVESYQGDTFAVSNCYQADAACDDWLISPALDLTQFESATLSFESAWNYGVDGLSQMSLKVSSDYTLDPSTATWHDVSDRATWSAGNFEFVGSGDVDLTDFVGQPIVIAFHYAQPVADAAKWEIDDVLVEGMGTGDFPLTAEVALPDETLYSNRPVSLSASAFNGDGGPYNFSWNFGDGSAVAEGESVVHKFTAAGQYEVVLTVTDAGDNTVQVSEFVTVAEQNNYTVPGKAGNFRVASFNAGFDPYNEVGALKAAFDSGEDVKASKVAEIIQRANADILLLNEIDGNDAGATIESFKTHYLEVSQNGAAPVVYDYVYTSDCNTGVPAEMDFNNDGATDGPDDAYGFANYPGKYCMAIFSRYPVDAANARTFQKFLWKDMPGALQPMLDGEPWYSTEEWDAFRLSSKTHIDLPVTIDGKTVHILASHPTPPVFDGEEDRNGKRNFDEIRLWADYINPNSNYLYDDNLVAGVTLAADTRFIIVGDENASAVEGDAYTSEAGVKAIDQLLESPLVNPNLREDSPTFQVPTSGAGVDNTPDSIYAATHTADWAMRADYVLPSAYGFQIKQSGIFWPRHSDDLHYLVEATGGNDVTSSDHRLVWMDLQLFEGTVTEEQEPEPYLEDDFSGADMSSWTYHDAGESDIGWEKGTNSGVHFAKISCYKGVETCDDWMLRQVDLSAATDPVLSFRSAYNYGTDAPSQIRLKVSSNYAGDVTSATWQDLTAEANWSTGRWAFVDSGEISLSAFAGAPVAIAFQYTSVNGSDAATWEITDVKVAEASNENDPRGGTVLSDVAPADSLNDVNQRNTGTLVFNAVAAPVTAEEEVSILASDGATLDGTPVPGFGYKTLAKSGDVIDGQVYGAMKDKFGSDLFVSNYNEFTSIFPVEDRLFAVSQFESIPGGIYLSEVAQDPTTGELSFSSTQPVDLSSVNGGYNHCAAMVTPWNTHLASEEYEPDYAARSAATGGIDIYYDQIQQYHPDLSLVDINPYWYGFAVEVGVELNELTGAASSQVEKHYAMGRLSIEVAYVMPDQKTVYLTDDGTNGGLYLFVADTAGDLSAGSLYALKWNQTEEASTANAGMAAADIEWISLGHATNAEVDTLVNGESPVRFEDIFERVEPTGAACPLGYQSINFKGAHECLSLKPGQELAASRLETRRYAAYRGATVEMRKEEGITYNPHQHKMYLAISDIAYGMLNGDNADAGGANHIRISEANRCGGIYEMDLGTNSAIGSDYVIGRVEGLLSGEAVNGRCEVNNIAGPDNVAYIGYDTLIVTEDTDDHDNAFVWAYNLQNETLTRIFSAPSGAENTGPYMFNNLNGFGYISNVVQHPAGEAADPSPGNEAEVGYFGPIPLQ